MPAKALRAFDIIFVTTKGGFVRCGYDVTDCNSAEVALPNIAAGGSVTWTYRVTNTGNTSIPRTSKPPSRSAQSAAHP